MYFFVSFNYMRACVPTGGQSQRVKNSTEETAQYSLHAVGLVMHRDSCRLFIADPNGALIGGSNMEFLAMPLKKLNHRSTTKLSICL